MKELPPVLNQTEQQIHDEVNRHIDPTVGWETTQNYPHRDGDTRTFGGDGVSDKYDLGNEVIDRESSRVGASIPTNMPEIFDSRLRHSGSVRIGAEVSRATPKGVVSRIKGRKPTHDFVTSGSLSKQISRERSYDEPENAPSYTSSVYREAKTGKSVNEQGDVHGDYTIVNAHKTTTHASRGNGPQEYKVKFSTPEKEKEYAELVQKVALKGIRRASPKPSGYVKHLATKVPKYSKAA